MLGGGLYSGGTRAKLTRAKCFTRAKWIPGQVLSLALLGQLHSGRAYPGTLLTRASLPWYHGTLVPWYRGTKVPWYHSTMVPWYHGTVVPWYHGTLVPWYHGTMVPWYHGTMVPWYHGTMVPWYHGTMVPWYRVVPGTMVPMVPW